MRHEKHVISRKIFMMKCVDKKHVVYLGSIKHRHAKKNVIQTPWNLSGIYNMAYSLI